MTNKSYKTDEPSLYIMASSPYYRRQHYLNGIETKLNFQIRLSDALPNEAAFYITNWGSLSKWVASLNKGASQKESSWENGTDSLKEPTKPMWLSRNQSILYSG